MRFWVLIMMATVSAFSNGTIVILNGPSAAGKSSIQKELQKQMKKSYLTVGIDTFFDALIPSPDLSDFEKSKFFAQYTNNHELIRSVEIKKDKNGFQIVPLTIGPAGDRIMHGMHSAIAAYANRKNNLIVDYILYKPEYLKDLVSALKGHKVYLIGIQAPLDVLEAREKNRGTSPIGHARSHFDLVHEGFIYDLELDVATTSPMDSASKIKAFIEAHPSPKALSELLKQESDSN